MREFNFYMKRTLPFALSFVLSSLIFAGPASYSLIDGEEDSQSLFVPSYDAVSSADIGVETLFDDGLTHAPDLTRVRQLLDLLSEKTSEALSRKTFSDTAEEKICEIESLKAELYELLNDGASEESRAALRSQMEEEIAQRTQRAARAAEVNPDGSLNERGQKSLANDIEAIQEKYRALSESCTPSSETMAKAKNLTKKIQRLIEQLESTSFKESSLQDGGLSLSVGRFTKKSGVEGWPYVVSYVIDGDEIYSGNGLMTYKEISGKDIPSVPSIRNSTYEKDKKDYENFLDSVEVFNEAFSSGVNFIEATADISVKALASPSAYKVTVGTLTLKNIVTGKIVKSERKQLSKTYQRDQTYDIDFDASSEIDTSETIFAYDEEEDIDDSYYPQEDDECVEEEYVTTNESTPEVEMQAPESEEKKEKREKKLPAANKSQSVGGSLAGPKGTYGSVFYFLPGTVNTYLIGDQMDFTLGYSATFGVAPNFFLGFNLEASPTCLSEKYDSYSSYVATGLFGWNWSCGSWLRMSAFGEGGMILGNLAAGGGMSFEFASSSSDVALQATVAEYVTLDLKCITKASVGVEILF